jgi:hypothetical protein
MTRLRRGLTGTALAVAGLLVAAGPSYAAGSFQDCLDQAINHDGEPPTCTKINGTWVASWPQDSAGAGFSGAFGFLIVLGLLAAGAIVFWKVSTAQKLAKQSGMDPSLATQMTLLTDDGLEATYLASSLRQPSPTPSPTPSPSPSATPPASVAARLQELQGLLDQGLVSQAEYDERRKAIIESV